MSAAIWEVKLQDDITAVSKRMAVSVGNLRKDVGMLGNQFKTTNAQTQSLTIKLKDARALFKAAGYNVSLFKAALKDAGVSALDSRILIGKMTSELNSMRRSALGMDGVFKKIFSPRTIWIASHTLNVLSKGYGVLSTVVGGVAGAVGKIAGTVYDAGKGLLETVIDAAQFRQNALTGLEYMLGSKEAANDMFAYAQKAAQETPLDTDKVIKGLKELVSQGFSGDEAKLLYKAVADQQSKFLDDEGMQDKVIAAFSRVKGRGVATGEDLESFRVAGFRAEGIVEQLQKNPNLAPLFAGLKGKDHEAQLKGVKEVLGKGKIGSTTFLNAALASMEKGKPDLGKFAAEFGTKSLTGAISNVKASFTDLLKSVDLQNWPGIQALLRFINRIVDALKPGAATANRMLGGVQGVVDALLGGLDRVTDKDIAGFITTISDLGLAAVGVIKEAWGWLDKLIHHADGGGILDAIGDVLIEVGKMIGAGIWEGVKGAGSIIGAADERKRKKYGVGQGELEYQAKLRGVDVGTMQNVMAQNYAAFKASGQKVNVPWGGDADRATFDAVQAYAQEQAYKSMFAVGVNLVKGAIKGAETEGQMRSPSRAMAKRGEYLVRGMLNGVDGATRRGDRSGGAGGSGVQLNFAIYASGDGAAASIEEAVKGPVLRELTTFFERVQQEG